MLNMPADEMQLTANVKQQKPLSCQTLVPETATGEIDPEPP
jgi:hypothetical protein